MRPASVGFLTVKTEPVTEQESVEGKP